MKMRKGLGVGARQDEGHGVRARQANVPCSQDSLTTKKQTTRTQNP